MFQIVLFIEEAALIIFFECRQGISWPHAIYNFLKIYICWNLLEFRPLISRSFSSSTFDLFSGHFWWQFYQQWEGSRKLHLQCQMVFTTTPHNAKPFSFMDCQFNFFSFVHFCMHDAWYIYNMTIFDSQKKKKRTNFRFQLCLLSSRQKWPNLMTYKQEFWIQWLLRQGKWGTFWIGIFLFLFQRKIRLSKMKCNMLYFHPMLPWQLQGRYMHNNKKMIRLILFFRIIKFRL